MKTNLLFACALTLVLTSCSGSSSSESAPEKAADGLPGISLQTALPYITEGQQAVIAVGLSRALPTNTELIWEITDGANRFTSPAGSVILPAGQTTALVNLNTNDNSLFDGDTRAVIRVRDSGGALTPAEIGIGIGDNDPIPFVSIADQEGVRGSRIDLAIELSTASNLDTIIEWRTQDATARAGVDYVAASGVARIPAGETRAIIGVNTLPLAHDSNFTVKLTSVTNASPADSSATAHILPGNSLDTKVSFAAASTSVSEDVGTAAVIVQLSNPVGLDVSVDLTVEGDAALGSDYSAFPTTIVIPAGASSATIAINIVDDQVFERDETLRLRLKSSTNASFGIQTTHNVLIADNDPAPAISVSDAQVTEGRALSFSVSLDKVSGADTTFSYRTLDGSAGLNDYVAVAGTVTIPKGQTVARVTVPTIQDSLYEENEYMTLSLSAADGASLSRASARGTILDDDAAPTVQFATASQAIGAGQSTVNVVVSLGAVSGAPVRIPFHVDGTGVEGVDHNLAPGVINIPAGQTSATVSFSVFTHEGKTAILNLDAGTGAILGTITTHTVSF